MDPNRGYMQDQQEDEEIDFQEIDELNAKDRKAALVLEEILGKTAVLKLYSKYPEVRAQALNDFKKGLALFQFEQLPKDERDETFVAMFAVINKGCNDSDLEVNLSAIDLIIQMMADHEKDLVKISDKKDKKELRAHQASIIDSLLIKLGSDDHTL